ncbi:MAG TPA: integrase arm-type DNA-binding domain-containing protein [Rhizomicrobium sp.]|nr:integrase arm-type DNA-binding domain-containing protein [Rhizomicrobium sp.]
MTKITSTKAIDTLATEGRYSAGNGLYLSISSKGGKSWVLRYQLRGRRHDAGLGVYPIVSLSSARLKALDAQRFIAQGKDPIQEWRAAMQGALPVPTFGDMAQVVLTEVASKYQNEKNRYRADLLLGPKYCYALIPLPVNTITASDVANLLGQVAATKPETARKLHGHLRKVFETSRVKLRETHNIILGTLPTDLDDLRALGFTPQVTNEAYPALDWRDAPGFMSTLRARTGIAFRALEFTILTGLRESAAAAAQWPEIDIEAGIWTVPLERLKDRQHRKQPLRVPLSSRAKEVLALVRGLDGRWVFPGLTPNSPINPYSMLQALKVRLNRDENGQPIWLDPDSKRPIVVHGFRATLKTFGDDHNFRWEVTEYSLGHAVGGQVERRYRRTDLLEERRRFLQSWADYCGSSQTGRIITFRQLAASG